MQAITGGSEPTGAEPPDTRAAVLHGLATIFSGFAQVCRALQNADPDNGTAAPVESPAAPRTPRQPGASKPNRRKPRPSGTPKSDAPKPIMPKPATPGRREQITADLRRYHAESGSIPRARPYERWARASKATLKGRVINEFGSWNAAIAETFGHQHVMAFANPKHHPKRVA